MSLEDTIGCFRCAKIGLIVVYSVWTLFLVAMVLASIWELTDEDGADLMREWHRRQSTKPVDPQAAKNKLVENIVIGVVSILMNVVALIGVVRENKCILILFSIIGVGAIFVYVRRAYYMNSIISFVAVIMIGQMTSIVLKEHKQA